MKRNFDLKRFSQYTLQTIIFSTNHSKRAADSPRMNQWNITLQKVKIKVQICGNRQRASELRVNESDISFKSF